ncbi:MAG: hypothetical protein OXH90_11185 [Paracoccaceae bacterium]|nr:hypothetical protein [Paracoccaceae bacterium]MDE2917007.1 hypothetical protein [Paracoccaceae bacterium]
MTAEIIYLEEIQKKKKRKTLRESYRPQENDFDQVSKESKHPSQNYQNSEVSNEEQSSPWLKVYQSHETVSHEDLIDVLHSEEYQKVLERRMNSWQVS